MKLEDIVTLWELNGQIVAVLNPDHPDEAFFQIHPAYQNEVAMSEMPDVAEAKFPKAKDDGRKELIVWVNAADDSTKRLFTEGGYAHSKFSAEYMRRRFLSDPVPDSTPQAGYTIRALGDECELPAQLAFVESLSSRRAPRKIRRLGMVQKYSTCPTLPP